MSKKAVLTVSFGTSYNDNRKKTIVPMEKAIAGMFPDREPRRAWTSRMIIAKLKKRDDEHIDYIDEALDRLVSEKFDDVIVQPTHVMNGEEYDFVRDIVSSYKGKFAELRLGKPMLTSDEDYDNVVEAIEKDILPLSDADAFILMGHGSEHFANSAYSELQLKLQFAGHGNVFVTTVEGFPSFGDTVGMMKGRGYAKVAMMPFMIVAGDHANNDMAGKEEDSLRSVMEKEGYRTECIVRGLGELPSFRAILADHAAGAEKL